MSNNTVCPFCHRPIWDCTCFIDFERDDDLDKTPVTQDEYDNRRNEESIDPDTLESPYLNPEEVAAFHEPLNKADERLRDALRKDFENLGTKERLVFELRFRKDKKQDE